MISLLSPVVINKITFEKGSHELKQNDSISFPGDTDNIPHIYHV